MGSSPSVNKVSVNIFFRDNKENVVLIANSASVVYPIDVVRQYVGISLFPTEDEYVVSYKNMKLTSEKDLYSQGIRNSDDLIIEKIPHYKKVRRATK